MATNILTGAIGYFFYHLPREMFFSLMDYRCLLCKIHAGWLIWPVSLGISVSVLVGFLGRLRSPRMGEWFWLFYWPIICSWNAGSEAPVYGFHFQPRYLLPILPLAALYFVDGTIIISSLLIRRETWARRAWMTVAFSCAVYVLVTSLAVGGVRLRNEWRVRGLSAWSPARVERIEDAAFARYIEAGLWLKENTPTNVVIASRKPQHTYLFSKRKGFRYDTDWLGEDRDIWGNILAYRQYGPVYILQDAFPAESGYGQSRVHGLDPAIMTHAGDLEMVFETKEPVTRVWRVKSERQGKTTGN